MMDLKMSGLLVAARYAPFGQVLLSEETRNLCVAVIHSDSVY
jgi:hypothetical protein